MEDKKKKKTKNNPEKTKPVRKVEDVNNDEKIIEVVPVAARRVRMLLAVLVVLLAVVVIYNVVTFVKSKIAGSTYYEGYQVISSTETTGDNVASYIAFNDNVIKYTKDGASYIDASGNTVWDCSYDMKMPEAVVSGDYAVIADLNGRDVYVFNKSGKVSSQTMNYDITNVDVASQGVYVLVLDGDDCNYINGYDKDGASIYEVKTSIENSGYPLDIAISEDGEKLFASYVQVDSSSVVNYIAAYNFGSVGQNENADRLMGGYTFDDTIFPYVEFINSNTVACFGDNQIAIYSMSEKPSEKAVIEVEDEILAVFANEDSVGYITENASTDSRYKIYIYDTSGKQKTEFEYNSSFSEIYATEDELIIVGEFDCSIYYMTGEKKFSTTFTKSLESFVPDGNKLEYIAIFSNETQLIKLMASNSEE